MSSHDDAVALLARERWRALVGYAYVLTGSRGDAEDLVQDALVRLVLRGRDGTDLHAAEAYARQAVLNLYLDRQRRRGRWTRIRSLLGREEDVTAPDPASAAGAHVDVAAALALLSPRERACVVLRHLEDLSVAETAERLGVSTGAVKKYTSTAMARLAGILGPVAPVPDTSPVERTVSR